MNPKVGELIDQYTALFHSVSDSPRTDAQYILTHGTGRQKSWLYSHTEETLSEPELARVQTLAERRAAGEPIAYLMGEQGFWNRQFQVTDRTLIPRPETELLVETILDRFDNTPLRVLDLGTGSGAIAVSLAAERAAWQVTATDIDAETLATARTNAVDVPNVSFLVSDWFSDVTGSFDLIVSNPPYIRSDDPHLINLAYEPKQALVSGEDGLDAIRSIIAEAKSHLVLGGTVMLEHGYDQQPAVTALLNDAGYLNIETFSDLNPQPRAVLARTAT